MNDVVFNLFIEVINAAKTGRFCHGNAAQWYIVDVQGNNLCIDTTSGKIEVVAPNPVAPHVCLTTARNLEEFLMESEANYRIPVICKGHGAVSMAAQDILSAHKNGRVLHYNGGQCTINTGWGNVKVYDLCVAGQVTIHNYDKLGSWKYMRINNGYNLNEDSVKLFQSLI